MTWKETKKNKDDVKEACSKPQTEQEGILEFRCEAEMCARGVPSRHIFEDQHTLPA